MELVTQTLQVKSPERQGIREIPELFRKPFARHE
jgi:hypothetical protein